MSDVRLLDPVVTGAEADRLVAACRQFPVFTPSGAGSWAKKRQRRRARRSAEAGAGPPVPVEPVRRFAPGLDQRVDSVRNYRQQGGLRNDHDDPLLAYRHLYFRETLLDGEDIHAPGIEEYLRNEVVTAAAGEVYGRPLVAAWNVYANIMLPGQELGLHTDTPEFRGAHRDSMPAWLLCAMHLSGLFEPWRVHIATAVAFLTGDERSGAFVSFEDGARAAPKRYPAKHHTALLLDTDSIFHGVEVVAGDDEVLRHVDVASRLVPTGRDGWELRCGEPGKRRVVATYNREDLRLSLSWKGYCFADEAEQRSRTDASGALSIDRIVDILTSELLARGRLTSADHGLSEEDFGMLVIDEFVDFPAAPSTVGAPEVPSGATY